MPPEPLDYRTPPSYIPADITCPRCGGADLIEGSLNHGASAGRFLPSNVRSFWTYNNGVKAITRACLTCGIVSTTIEPRDLLSKGATNITTPRKLGRMFRFLNRARPTN